MITVSWIYFILFAYCTQGCTVTPSGEAEIQDTIKMNVSVLDSAHGLTDILSNQTLIDIEDKCGMGEEAATAL